MNRVVETYIPVGPIFVYLFAVIDVYSRKIVGWHLGLNATIDSMKKAWDKALTNEGLLGVIGAPKMPFTTPSCPAFPAGVEPDPNESLLDRCRKKAYGRLPISE